MTSAARTFIAPLSYYQAYDSMRPYSMSSFHYPAGRQSPQEGPSRDVQQQSAYGAQQSVNLPPISSIDPRQQQQRPSHSPAPGDIGQQRQQQALGQPGPQYASHLPSMPQYYQPSMAAGGQYLGGPAAPMTSSPLPPGHRFPLPPAQDPHNIVPGARPKKDIKRRTKTGCLTCRKRRIKCDEGHPACRNCVKSKRECLGYDPVFKQQLSPSSIQPASLLQSPTSSADLSQLHLPSYTSAGQLTRTQSSSTGSPVSPIDHRDTLPPLRDPNFARSGSTSTSSSTAGGAMAGQDMQQRLGMFGPELQKMRHMNIDDLCYIDEQVSTPISASSHHDSQNIDAIQTIYNTSFAPGLDRLLETTWFTREGFTNLIHDRPLLSQFENYLAAIPTSSASIANQEARLLWALLCMCRRRPPGGSIADFVNGTSDNPDGDETASNRLDVLEALITGGVLPTNPLPLVPDQPPMAAAAIQPLDTQRLSRAHAFWHAVGESVIQHPNNTPSSQAQTQALEQCRNLLDVRENRDVVYSIMLMRRIGDVWPGSSVLGPDGAKANAEWRAAAGFLQSESRGQARDVVMGRLCSMALRAWGD